MNSPEKWRKWLSLAQKKWQEMKAPPNPKMDNHKRDFKKTMVMTNCNHFLSARGMPGTGCSRFLQDRPHCPLSWVGTGGLMSKSHMVEPGFKSGSRTKWDKSIMWCVLHKVKFLFLRRVARYSEISIFPIFLLRRCTIFYDDQGHSSVCHVKRW